MTGRVVTLGPMPPEKSAFALARYSRSADSIRQSIEWVRTHDSAKFLESFYFQYGHASIADLGHVAVCFEGISELAATEIEDEQLWDGQARSSRYQDFSKAGFITPPEFGPDDAATYQAAAGRLLTAYQSIHQKMFEHYLTVLPRPAEMPEAAYRRNITARAFDVARYLLFFGIPTNVGQVTSIRTLERQIRRMKASGYGELRELGDEATAACALPPECTWSGGAEEALMPTLAKYVHADEHLRASRADLRLWASQNLTQSSNEAVDSIDLLKPTDTPAEIAATLLYPVTDRPFRALYEMARGWSAAQRREVVDVALRSRSKYDDLLREFRGGLYVYDMVIDIGAYRDMHRHRRCQQHRQDYTAKLGFATPQDLREAGAAAEYEAAINAGLATLDTLPQPGAQYLLPFGAHGRFLFKMDFAEAEYISKLRSGVKGHFSYREIAWKMRERMIALEPELGNLIEATPPWVVDPLTR